MSTPAAAARLESAAAAAAVLDAYDRAGGTWRLPLLGEFWDAVAEAHRRGLTGQGRCAAVVDSAFDLTIPALHAAAGGAPRLPGRAGEPIAHGTVVALLILAVAPDTRLDLYEVTAGGVPDVFAVRAALRRIGASDVQAACLSLGIATPRAQVRVEPEDSLAGLRFDEMLVGLFTASGRQQATLAACPAATCLCAAARAVATTGRIVVAAAGNDVEGVFCPALADGVVSAGFQLDQRELTAEQSELAYAMPPDYPQSLVTDVTIRQPHGVLGSSFSAPLATGAALLGLDAATLPAMIDSARFAAQADAMVPKIVNGDWPAALGEFVLRIHARAIAAFPGMPALLDRTHWCIGSALFATTLLINAAYAEMRFGEEARAETLLRAARHLVPANPHAAANLAALLHNRATRGEGDVAALCREALDLCLRAKAARPGYAGYDDREARIRATLGAISDQMESSDRISCSKI